MNQTLITTNQAPKSDSSRALHEFTKGLRILHGSPNRYDCLHGEVPSLQQWTAASLVLMDKAALDLCLVHRLPERARVLLVTSASSGSKPWLDAARLGVECVLELPTESRKLREIIALTLAAHRADYKLLVLLGQIVWP